MIWVGPCSHEMKEQRFKYSCDGLQTSLSHLDEIIKCTTMKLAFLNVQQSVLCIFPCRSIKIHIIIFNRDIIFT